MQVKTGFYSNTDGRGYYYMNVQRGNRWDTIRTEWYDSEEEAKTEFEEKLKAIHECIDEIL